MKKLVFALAVCLAVTACFNRQKKTADPAEKSEAELMAEAVVKIQLDSIAEEIGKLQPVSVVKCVRDGEVVLTDAEKAVKPDYLADPAYAKDLQTLAQKYRAVAILGVDAEIAKLYEMPTADYDAALVKLYADINDPSIKEFNEAGTLQVALEKSYITAKANGRQYFFWEAATAALVEQAYIASRNIDKFIVAFDDKTAKYTYDDMTQLDLAYCTTVHKSQGNEFEAVIIPLFHTPRQLLYRNLLYTAVTRAKKLLILVGRPEQMTEMIENNKKTIRYTMLADFLAGKGGTGAEN